MPVAGWVFRSIAIDKAEFHRRDGEMETHWEITVSTENPAEVRRLTLTNHDDISHAVELTSYVELALTQHAADLAHPAYGKLFLETEYLPGVRALLAHRRPAHRSRSAHLGDARGGGRGPIRRRLAIRNLTGRVPRSRPFVRATARSRSGHSLERTGRRSHRSDLQPAAARDCAPGRCRHSLIFDSSDNDARRSGIARRPLPLSASRRSAFELAWAHAPVELQHLGMTASEAHLVQRLAGHILYPNPTMRASPAVLRANRLAQDGLWKFGISGDAPIVLVTLATNDDVALVRQLLQAHAYWRYNGLVSDLVILDELAATYLDDFNRSLQQLIRSSPARCARPPGRRVSPARRRNGGRRFEPVNDGRSGCVPRSGWLP